VGALRIGNARVHEKQVVVFKVRFVPQTSQSGTQSKPLNHSGIIMKLSTRILVPLAFTLAAGASFAEGPLQGNEVFSSSAQSSLSRAEVRDQAVAARAAGLIARGEILPVQADRGVGKSRDQVRAELTEARRLGLLASGEMLPIATPEQSEQIRMAGVRATQIVQK
jgi:hypothetical protein